MIDIHKNSVPSTAHAVDIARAVNCKGEEVVVLAFEFGNTRSLSSITLEDAQVLAAMLLDAVRNA